jgi:hypothetical protein
MNNKSTLESRLARYSAVAGAVITGTAVNAQVAHTDLSPDVTVNSTIPYVLDFNGDATMDLAFGVSILTGTFTYASNPGTYNGPLAFIGLGSGNAMVGGMTTFSIFSSSVVDPTQLNSGDPINAAAQWQSGTGILGYNVTLTIPAFSFSTTVTGGNWLGVNDKFIGARFMIGTNTHYGWARISVASDASTITVKEYAYQQDPNCAINAAAITGPACPMGLEDVALENKVTITNQLEQAAVNVTPDLIGGKIIITNMMGQVVNESRISNVNTMVSFGDLSTGIYNISAQFDGGVVTKKIYVK